MEKKQLISEIQRNLNLMGVNKNVRIYEDSQKNYKILLKEGWGTFGNDVANWLTTTAKQFFEEVPGILDQYGNKVTKMFFEIGNNKIPGDVYSLYLEVLRGTKRLVDLGTDNAKKLIDIINELKPELVTRTFDDVVGQAASRNGISAEDIIKALRKKVSEGAKLEDEVLDMCGGDELLADVLIKTFKTKIDEFVGDSFKGTLEDAIKKAFANKWGGVIDNLPIEKTIKDYVKSFLTSDGWLRQMRALTLDLMRGWQKNQDALIQEGLRDCEAIFQKILSEDADSASMKNIFRKFNATLDSIDPNKLDELRTQFLNEIKKLEFNVGGKPRKLTEQEIKIIQEGLVNNKVFGDDISSWVVEAWNKSYWGKYVKNLFKMTGDFRVPNWLTQTWWLFITTTVRTGNDWSKILRTRTFFKELGSIWWVTTIVMKLVWPAVIAFFSTLYETIKFAGQTDNPESQNFIMDLLDGFLEELKNAWMPNDSALANVIEIVIPIHASPFVKLVGYIDDVRKDKVNINDLTERLRQRFPEITEDQIAKYKAWYDRNKDVSLDNITDDTINNLDDLGSSETGFKAYCQLKGYEFVGWGALSQIGKAQVPNEGLKEFEWRDDVNDFVKTN